MSEYPKVILAVCGGIAAYKMPDLASGLKKNSLFVGVIQTPNSERFVTPASLEAMSDVYFTHKWGRPMHIEITEDLIPDDAFVVVPATANTIAKIAYGIADNLVTDTAVALPEEVNKIMCYAMNTRMVNNVAVQRNIRQLKDDGWLIMEPVEGKLACGTTGKGKLPPTREIVKFILKAIS